MASPVHALLESIGLRAEEPPSAEGWARLLELLDARLAGDDAFWDAMDASESANRLKSEFLGVMSHELRTPLNGILGMAQLLRDTDLDDDRREWVETILSSGESLLTIVNAILDFSKLEAGSLALVDGMTSPATLVYDTAQLFAATAHQKGLRLACAIEGAVPEVAGADDRRVRQVLANLVGNAIKFTEEGHVIVRLRAATKDGRETLRFEVEDTGTGIDAAVQSRIFESFVQGDASETRHHGGTGLGLAIAKRLANLMGGDISFTTMAKVGSTFTFEMPLRAYDDEDMPKSQRLRRALRILVLERIPGMAEAHRSLIARAGFEVRVAGSIGEARGVFEKSPGQFDVLFIDGSGNLDKALEQCETLAGIPHAPPAFLLVPSGNSLAASRTERARVAVVCPAPFRPEIATRLEEAADGVKSSTGRSISRPPPAPGERKKRALVVEDNSINQRVAVRTLERLGLEAASVGNGRDALDKLRRERFDVVFMDCQMPLMNGYEATRRLREEEANGNHVPVIAMTAQSMPGDRERCLEAGMDDYISKPLRIADIEEKLATWVHRS